MAMLKSSSPHTRLSEVDLVGSQIEVNLKATQLSLLRFRIGFLLSSDQN